MRINHRGYVFTVNCYTVAMYKKVVTERKLFGIRLPDTIEYRYISNAINGTVMDKLMPAPLETIMDDMIREHHEREAAWVLSTLDVDFDA